jgi:hypothetical protein
MRPIRRLLLLSFALLAVLCGATAAEPIAGLMLEDNFAAYENVLLRALGDAAETWEKKTGAAPAFDPQAAAMKAGDWARAQAEIATAMKSDDRVLQARGHVRAAWLLARLGGSHYAADRANQGLHEPTAQGEALLARAWLTWHIGAFALADEQAALAARVEPAAPAWAWAEWRQFHAAHAQAATAAGTADAPEEVLTAAYLDYADRLRAAGALNRADFCYNRFVVQLRDLGPTAPAATRALAPRALTGLRDGLLAMWGGRLPGPGFAPARVLILERARDAAAAGPVRAEWERFFTLLAEVQPDAAAIDLSFLDLHGDLAVAEKQAGLGPEWRDRLKPLLADPRLRYASRLAQALARCEAHPGYGVKPEIADAAPFDALFTLLESEQKVLAGLRALMPADAPAVAGQARFDQVDAVTRLRRALQRGEIAAARTQFDRLDEADSLFRIDTEAFKPRLVDAERQEFFKFMDELDDYEAEAIDPADIARLTRLATRTATELYRTHGSDVEKPARLTPIAREEAMRILYVPVLAAVNARRVLRAEAALAKFEAWSRDDLVRDSTLLKAARAEVAAMPMDKDEFVGDEKSLWDALAKDQAERAFVPTLRAAIAKDPERLTPRTLLALAHWRLAEDAEAAKVIDETRRLAPHAAKLHQELDRFTASNDTARVCADLARQLQQAAPEKRAEVAAAARATANRFIARIRRVWNEDQPIEIAKFKSPAFRSYSLAYGLLGHVAVAEGKLNQALGLLDTLRRTEATEAHRALLPVVERAPFRHDFPTPELVTAWSTLLSGRTLPPAELQQLYAQFQPHLGKSLSVELAYCMFLALSRDSAKAQGQLATLLAVGRPNRAFARQLSAMDGFIRARTEERTVLLFGNERATQSQWSNTQQELNNFVDANREALKTAYQNNENNDLTRYVERLEKQIKELRRIADAEAEKNRRGLVDAANDRQRQQADAVAELKKLTL